MRQGTLEPIADVARAHGGRCLSEHYTTRLARYRFSCARGHRFEASGESVLYRGTWCPQCAGNAPHGIERFRAWAESHGGVCLSDVYVNVDTPLHFRCAHGHTFSLTPRAVLRSGRNGCAGCRRNGQAHARFEQLRERVARLGYALEPGKYIDSNTPLLVSCANGHRRHVRPEELAGGMRCARCRDDVSRRAKGADGRTADAPLPMASADARGQPTNALTRHEPSLRGAIRQALALPRRPRESPLNLGQLRLLAQICAAEGLERGELHEIERHREPTVDKRLAYLREKELIYPAGKLCYHAQSDQCGTDAGQALYAAWRGERSHDALVRALDAMIVVPARRRETPPNVGHLLVLEIVVASGDIATDALLVRSDVPKPTLRSRLRYLEQLDLIVRRPLVNSGGHGHANLFAATSLGREIVTGLRPPGCVGIPWTKNELVPRQRRGRLRAR